MARYVLIVWSNLKYPVLVCSSVSYCKDDLKSAENVLFSNMKVAKLKNWKHGTNLITAMIFNYLYPTQNNIWKRAKDN